MQLTAGQKKLIESKTAAFATIGSDGNPHVIAVASLRVVGPDHVLISDNYMQTTKANIKHNPVVAFVVWDENTGGWQFKGIAEYYGTGEWVEKVKKIKENKGLSAKGAIIVTVLEARKSA